MFFSALAFFPIRIKGDEGDASPSWKARERYRIQRKDVIEFAWYTNHSGCSIASPEAIANR